MSDLASDFSYCCDRNPRYALLETVSRFLSEVDSGRLAQMHANEETWHVANGNKSRYCRMVWTICRFPANPTRAAEFTTL